MFDPVSGDLYMIEKNHEGPHAHIYKFTPPMEDTETPILMEDLGKLKSFMFRVYSCLPWSLLFPGILDKQMVVAGDISIDADKILIRRAFNEGAWMYMREVGQSVEDALLNNVPCDLILIPEEQGEAIAVDPSNTGFYTTSEGSYQPIFYYEFL